MKTFLLIGLGRFGRHIAVKLSQLGHEVLAIDKDEDRVNTVLPYVTSAQIGDSTREDFLSTLGVRNFDVCIVTLGDDFQGSLETVSLLKELGAKLVVARAARDVQEKFLLRNGADQVVYPEKQLGAWTAIRYSSEHLLDYIELNDDYGIFELDIPDSWEGKTIAQMDIRRRYHVNIMGLKEKSGQLTFSITPDTLFPIGGTMLVLGQHRDVQKYFHL